MNFVELAVADTIDGDRSPIRTDSSAGERRPPASEGNDASDILSDELLEERMRERHPGRNDAVTPLSVRGEFALLQRELATKITQFDRDCAVAYEDEELIIYALGSRKDIEYVFDYCEIEGRPMRGLLLEVMRSLALDRAGKELEFPLAVRKPHLFRAGERHAGRRVEAHREEER